MWEGGTTANTCQIYIYANMYFMFFYKFMKFAKNDGLFFLSWK